MIDSSQQNTPIQPEQQDGQQYNGDDGQFSQPTYAVPQPGQGSPSPAQPYANQPSLGQLYPNQPYSGQQSQPAQAQPSAAYPAQPTGPYSGAAGGPAGADMVYWEAKGYYYANNKFPASPAAFAVIGSTLLVTKANYFLIAMGQTFGLLGALFHHAAAGAVKTAADPEKIILSAPAQNIHSITVQSSFTKSPGLLVTLTDGFTFHIGSNYLLFGGAKRALAAVRDPLSAANPNIIFSDGKN
ncbi:hypothetical protein HMPREF9156_00677 [Scardovia wiggsiae F0424]|uniref:Uncharacterized protein n=1 Tax=Scardovia wiggsiae F0424 TaxID=857290 RepID=J0DFX1_9BIFI|nr:hypothetical protein [Scardovia wiggsiae]EJD65233.1 hypothetical protein HMPREF9156_00677 [Scardovia wiggsiae F0424]